MRTWSAQLRKGIVELAILAALRDGEAYGYQLLQRLSHIAALEASESSIYPILARLTREGLVTARSGPSPSGPPRRYYRLTAAGRSRLKAMSRQFDSLQQGVTALLEGQLP